MISDEATIRALTSELASALNDSDIDRLMALYSDRYVDVNLPQPVQTHSERADYYRGIVARGGVHLDVVADEIVVDGAHATVRGSIRLSASGTLRELRYMELWEKQGDRWKPIWGIDAEVHD